MRGVVGHRPPSTNAFPATGKWLIINADDLGLHVDINRGIRQAHLEGIVTSASLVPCGEAFDHAVRICRECPGMDVGIHLTLIGERPLTPTARIPSLVGSDGRFYPTYRDLAVRILSGQASTVEIRREVEAQVDRVVQAGIQPSHLDSHQHVHLLPQLWRVVVDIAVRQHIQWIRIPRYTALVLARRSRTDPFFRAGLNVLSAVRRRQLSALRCVHHTPGLHLSGRMDKRQLGRILTDLRSGVSELITHPGLATPDLERRYRWGYAWTEECAALSSQELRRLTDHLGIALVRFVDLAA